METKRIKEVVFGGSFVIDFLLFIFGTISMCAVMIMPAICYSLALSRWADANAPVGVMIICKAGLWAILGLSLILSMMSVGSMVANALTTSYKQYRLATGDIKFLESRLKDLLEEREGICKQIDSVNEQIWMAKCKQEVE